MFELHPENPWSYASSIKGKKHVHSDPNADLLFSVQFEFALRYYTTICLFDV